MKNRLGILLVPAVLAITCVHLFGQTKSCDTVYTTVDVQPSYAAGVAALMEYSGKRLTPIISKYHHMDSELTAKLTMTLTIDIYGKVVDAVLSNHKLPRDCENEIRKQLLTMNGWTAGSVNGQKVCSKFAWFISCIKWG